MLTAINSDLPGQVTGQVRENVYDSGTGKHLLIPQGTRLVGLYGHHIASSVTQCSCPRSAPASSS